jgi:hypothetical protein
MNDTSTKPALALGAGSRCPRIPPLSKQLHYALTAWLHEPGTLHTASNLHAALNEYELRHRIRKSLPAPCTPAVMPGS